MGGLLSVDPMSFRNPVQVEIRYSGPIGYGRNFDKVSNEIHSRIKSNSCKRGGNKNFQLIFFDYPIRGTAVHFEVYINGKLVQKKVPEVDSPEMDAIIEQIYQEALGIPAPPDALVCKTKVARFNINSATPQAERVDQALRQFQDDIEPQEQSENMERRIQILEQRLAERERDESGRNQKDSIQVSENKQRSMEKRMKEIESMLAEDNSEMEVPVVKKVEIVEEKIEEGVDEPIEEPEIMLVEKVTEEPALESVTEEPVIESVSTNEIPAESQDPSSEAVKPEKEQEDNETEETSVSRSQTVDSIRERLKAQIDREEELEKQLTEVEGLSDVTVDDDISSLSTMDGLHTE